MEIEKLIAYGIIAAALIYAVRRFYKALGRFRSRPEEPSCEPSACASCPHGDSCQDMEARLGSGYKMEP